MTTMTVPPLPVDLDSRAVAMEKLERIQALADEARFEARRDELRARIQRGAEAISAAQADGEAEADIQDAQRRLANLQRELNDLLVAFEIPMYVATLVCSVAEDAPRWGLDLPPGSHITVHIPGIVHRQVALKGVEPDVPF